MSEPLILVVSLWVDVSKRDRFSAFERRVASAMARYGGRIERVIRSNSDDGKAPYEVHLVTFPSAHAFASYREDPQVQALAETRAEIIERTEIVAGTDATPYKA